MSRLIYSDSNGNLCECVYDSNRYKRKPKKRAKGKQYKINILRAAKNEAEEE